MPAPISVNITASGSGLTIQSSQQVIANVTATLSPTLDVARSGTLTTRTNNNSGTLTLEAGHGITTGNRLDLFWLDPTTGQQRCQHKITAGTVSGNSVPISAGVGDNLPLAATAVTVQRVSELDFLLNTPDLIALSVGANAGGKVVLEKADGTVVHHQTLTPGGGGATWLAGSGASPVSDTVAKAFLSNASSLSPNTIQVLAGLTG
jgi:hypothetical protein